MSQAVPATCSGARGGNYRNSGQSSDQQQRYPNGNRGDSSFSNSHVDNFGHGKTRGASAAPFTDYHSSYVLSSPPPSATSKAAANSPVESDMNNQSSIRDTRDTMPSSHGNSNYNNRGYGNRNTARGGHRSDQRYDQRVHRQVSPNRNSRNNTYFTSNGGDPNQQPYRNTNYPSNRNSTRGYYAHRDCGGDNDTSMWTTRSPSPPQSRQERSGNFTNESGYNGEQQQQRQNRSSVSHRGEHRGRRSNYSNQENRNYQSGRSGNRNNHNDPSQDMARGHGGNNLANPAEQMNGEDWTTLSSDDEKGTQKFSGISKCTATPIAEASSVPSWPQYLAPQRLFDLDDTITQRVLKRFREELLQTTKPIPYLLRSLTDEDKNHLYTVIYRYFNHLASRLKVPQMSYLNLIDAKVYELDDFCSYGTRFVDFLRMSGLFKEDEITENLLTFKLYAQIHPEDIWTLRSKMLAIKNAYGRREAHSCSGHEEEVPLMPEIEVDYKMVTFKAVESRTFYASISLKETIQEQIDCFLNEISLSEKGRANIERFIDALNLALQSSPLAELQPVLVQFGSLTSGLASYDSDLDLSLKFNVLDDPESMQLDYSTSMLALGVIADILERKLGIEKSDRILIPSRRCPLVQMDFFWCFPGLKAQVYEMNKHLEFSSCDISVNRFYGMYNSKLFNFLATKYDRRFYELTLILKYWAKKQGFIERGYFTSYGFTLMILFYLQNVSPPVLPAIEQLQELGKEAGFRKEIMIHGYRFDFCDDVELIGKSTNEQNTAELVAGFFGFYYHFNPAKYAISPRLGSGKHYKEMLYQEKGKLSGRGESKRLDRIFKNSYFVIEDPFVLDHNVGSTFRESYKDNWLETLDKFVDDLSIDAENAITLLADPDNYDDGPITE